MKYLKIYINALFAALLLFSCTEDAILSQEVPGTDDAGTMFITLSLPLNGGSYTRTEGEREEEDRPGESGISNIRLVLVDSNRRAYELYTGAMQWTTQGNTATSRLISVKGLAEGTYYAYLVANATANDGNTPLPSDALSYSDLTAAYPLSPANAQGLAKVTADNRFLMANAHNIPDADFNGGVAVEVKGGHTEDNPLHINIPLERLASKISANSVSTDNFGIRKQKFRTADPNMYYTIDRISLTGIGLLNCAADYNLIQRWKAGSDYPTNKNDMLLQTPGSSASYPPGNYYSRINEYRASGGSDLFKAPETVFYCLENNSPDYSALMPSDEIAQPGTRMKGRTTGMLFRMRAHISKRATINEDINEDDQDPGVWTRAVADDRYPTFYKYNGELFAELSGVIAANPDLGITPDTPVEDLRAKGVEVFEDGTMYYLYWLQDDYYTNGGKSYYAVTRNTWYHLTLTDITTIGSDVPGGNDYNETDPIDYQPGEIVVSLKCAAWEFHQYSNVIQ